MNRLSKHRVILTVYLTVVAAWAYVMRHDLKTVAIFAAASFVVFSAILAIGAFRIQTNYYLTSFNGVKTDRKVISLTFDDGPAEYTAEILKVLKKHRIRATFFLVGKNAEDDVKTARMIAKNGHEIGNHTWSHSKWFDFFTGKKMEFEIIRADESIKKATGQTPKYFRPPYGVTNPVIARVMRRFSFTVVGWRFRTLDTVKTDPADVCERIFRNIRRGDVIVMHDHNRNAPEISERVIRWCAEKGYRIIPLSELIGYDA